MNKSCLARLKVISIKIETNSDGSEYRYIEMEPEYTSDPDSPNHSFSRWTPSARFTMTVTNPNVFDIFEQGKYIDISMKQMESVI